MILILEAAYLEMNEVLRKFKFLTHASCIGLNAEKAVRVTVFCLFRYYSFYC